MNRSSNDRISILFTESHEILPNSIYMECMKYEIHMNGGKKIILDLIKLEFLREKYKWKGIEKFHLDLRSFV